MNTTLKQYQYDLIKFLRSTDFSKAIVLTIAIVIPISVFSGIGNLEIGISLAMGCLLSSPSDVPGSFKHKVLGILFAALLGGFSFCVAGYSAISLWTVIPMLIIMMFGISYLSVYGFRASLVTFSGLLAVVLSFANITSGVEIWQKSLLIFAGGIWYMLISVGWYLLRPRNATEQLLGETMELTAAYLRLRTSLLENSADKESIKKEIFLKQAELNEHHESLREILISSRASSGNSGYTRKRLLVFIDLVDMLELAMANPVDYTRMHEVFQDRMEELNAFVDFNLQLAAQLEKTGEALHRRTELAENKIPEYLNLVKIALKEFREKVDVIKDKDAMLFLRNLFDYQAKQAQKINNIYRILLDLEVKRKIVYKSADVQKFITSQDYSFRKLYTNFNFDSAIFRHSLRLAVVVLIGYLTGNFFAFQNSYWILLTIVVIMRPNYGLTKERTQKRIKGTLIGGAIAIGIVFITQNEFVYAGLGLLSLTFAFSLIQRNYTTAAIFITLSIVFIYALLEPEVLNVIQYRIIDTIVGAGLAAFGNFILWPKWELQNIRNVIAGSIEANLAYLNVIDAYYHKKGQLPLSYKLARKKAFLEIGNLSAAFQRMTQEPKSRQGEIAHIYEIVELNQTFLSALASMGTYIRTHHTTRASADFETYAQTIINNLQNSVDILLKKGKKKMESPQIAEAGKSLRRKFDKLVARREQEIKAGQHEIEDELRHKLQEAHLITGQLNWLLDISEKLQAKTEELNRRLNE